MCQKAKAELASIRAQRPDYKGSVLYAIGIRRWILPRGTKQTVDVIYIENMTGRLAADAPKSGRLPLLAPRRRTPNGQLVRSVPEESANAVFFS